MTTEAATSWAELRAMMQKRKISVAEIAAKVDVAYARFATIINATEETNPTPAFAERVRAAIEEITQARAA